MIYMRSALLSLLIVGFAYASDEKQQGEAEGSQGNGAFGHKHCKLVSVSLDRSYIDPYSGQRVNPAVDMVGFECDFYAMWREAYGPEDEKEKKSQDEAKTDS